MDDVSTNSGQIALILSSNLQKAFINILSEISYVSEVSVAALIITSLFSGSLHR